MRRDWDEPCPRGTDAAIIWRIYKAMREIEEGRAPATQWELEAYAEA
jgi:hypothetical protein